MRKAQAKISFIIIASSLLTSFGQPKSEWGGSVEEIDGVTVVKNPKEPIYGEDVPTLEENLVLGAEEHEGEPLFLPFGPSRLTKQKISIFLITKLTRSRFLIKPAN